MAVFCVFLNKVFTNYSIYAILNFRIVVQNYIKNYGGIYYGKFKEERQCNN